MTVNPLITPREWHTQHADRLMCSPEIGHVLATGNPWDDRTYCLCGAGAILGQHTTWHDCPVYDHTGKGAVLTHFTRHHVGECRCHPKGTVPFHDLPPRAVSPGGGEAS